VIERTSTTTKDGAAMLHPEIRPVQRDCICPTQPTTSHTKSCEGAFREKFFGAWGAERAKFYGVPRATGHDGAFGLYVEGPDGHRESA
jgi:hypothetical protein